MKKILVTALLSTAQLYAMEASTFGETCKNENYEEIFQTFSGQSIDVINSRSDELKKVARSFCNNHSPNLSKALEMLEAVEANALNTKPELAAQLCVSYIQINNIDKALIYLRKFASEKFNYYGQTKYYYDNQIVENFDLALNQTENLLQKKALLELKRDYLNVINLPNLAFEVNKDLYTLYKKDDIFFEDRENLKKIMLHKATLIATTTKQNDYDSNSRQDGFLLWVIREIYEKEELDLSSPEDSMFFDWAIVGNLDTFLNTTLESFFNPQTNTHPCYYNLVLTKAAAGSQLCFNFIEKNMRSFFQTDNLQDSLLKFLVMQKQYLKSTKSYDSFLKLQTTPQSDPFYKFINYYFDIVNHPNADLHFLNQLVPDEKLNELANIYNPAYILIWDRLNKSIPNAQEEIECYKGNKWRMDLGRYQSYPLTEDAQEIQSRRKFIEIASENKQVAQKIIFENLFTGEFADLFYFYSKFKKDFGDETFAINPIENVQKYILNKLQ